MFKVIPRSQIIDFPSQNIDLVQKVYILWLSKRSFNTYLRKQIFRSTNESCSLVRETLGTRLHHNKAKVLNSRDSFTCSNNVVRVMYSDVSYPWACSQDHLIRFKEVFLCEPLQHDKIYCADDSYKGVPGKTAIFYANFLFILDLSTTISAVFYKRKTLVTGQPETSF